MKKSKNNPLFSFHRGAMVPRRTMKSVERRARKASYTPGFLGVKSQKEELEQLRLMREIAKLGRREKNSVAKKSKKTKKKKKSTRPRKGTKGRRRTTKRNPKRRTLTLNLALNTKQKRTLASFLRRATGRRVKVQ